ncbi:restriction endonuclease subunit S [Pseudogemmobacter sp. W21_MBD1_M6]|uniref:restriction endonuclease subunit S n=1 Tax=Pseudogemmobacter sp. W21_MBD1_M6 TaxID=3240271 RepID=UPI003F9A71B1
MKDATFSSARLLALYDRISDAEDAIPRLRRFVLDLAVRGKLVEQDAGDEPAAELLKRIVQEKARLVKSGEIRKPKAKPLDISESEFPFSMPEGWHLAALDTLSPRSLVDGDWIETKDQAENGGVRLIQLADVGVGAFLDKSNRFLTEETEVRLNCTRLEVGDVLIARLPNPIGRACVFLGIGQPAITVVDVAILRPDRNASADFIVLAMNAPTTRAQIEAYGKGATRFRVSTGHLKTVLIPLPPLAEQQRIVAKVDELMALCDRLQAARAGREAVRDRLTAASLARLTAPEADAETIPAPSFQTNARFALQSLTTLTTRPDQIKTLRQTILDLAVRGKLVAQDPTDEPAAELMRRIEESPKKAMRGKESSSGEAAVKSPHDLPEQWVWTTFGELPVEARVGLDRGKAQQGPELAFAYFKMNNIANDGGMDLSSLARIDASEDEAKCFRLENGDFLFNTRNSRELVGKTCIFRLTDSEIFLFNNNILRAKFHPDVCPDFVDIWFRSPIGRDLIEGLKSNTTNVCAIYQGKLLSYPCPLPPFAEQHRIVAKVDALMALCDQLEASLTTTATTRRKLLNALLYEALEPSAEELEVAQ